MEEEIEPVAGRTAEDYAKALDTVAMALDAADIVLSFVPGASQAKGVLKIAKHLPQVKEALQSDTAHAAIKKAAPLLDKAGEAAPDAARKAAGAVSSAAASAGSAVVGAASVPANAIAQSIRGAADARSAEKARREARKLIFGGAGVAQSAETFMENYENHAGSGKVSAIDYLVYPGCYLIVTTERTVRDGDYSRAKAIYVGKSENIGEAIRNDFIGLGNADVYADVKYKQHVYALLYPCAVEDIDKLHDSLIVALDADNSYNAEKE